jgi:hypothetical protein
MMRYFILAAALALAAPAHAARWNLASYDFTPRADVVFVDLSQVKKGASVHRVWVKHFTRDLDAPTPRVKQFTLARLKIDCVEQNYKLEGGTVYAADLSQISEIAPSSGAMKPVPPDTTIDDLRRITCDGPVDEKKHPVSEASVMEVEFLWNLGDGPRAKDQK